MSHAPLPYAVEMRQIVKRFGPVTANRGVDLAVRPGEIHALLGENGAGKSTLMRILYGLYQADAGEILIHGRPAQIRSPKDAIGLGIGMVTQHFALAAPHTVAENIVLGQQRGIRLDRRAAEQAVAQVAQQVGLDVDPAARVQDLSVGQRQRVEILKALYRQAEILILDEPTAVLAPQEATQLFASLKRLTAQGLAVIFISHKLHEVMAITDRVTVLRGGSVVGTVTTAESSPSELARLMVGRATFDVGKTASIPVQAPLLQLDGVSALDNQGLPALKGVTFTVHGGEIVGIAGVAGNGQTELAQVVEGIRRPTAGRLLVQGRDLTNAGPVGLMAAGVGRIPEERHSSVVGELSVAHNLALEHLEEFTRFGVLDRQALLRHADQLIAEYQIKAAPNDPIRTLSGGNMQKVILARVLERKPRVIMVSQPTRGLDVGATEYMHRKLLEQRDKGAAILLISEDLDELLLLADRIAVLYEGEIMGILPTSEATAERLGLLMAGVREA
jgi:ABC-type uncharacterized transport system ATPase subunit